MMFEPHHVKLFVMNVTVMAFLVRILSYRTLRFDSGESMCTRNSLRGIYFLMNFYLVQNS